MKINKFIKIWNNFLDSFKITEIKEKSIDNNNNLKLKDGDFGEFDELFNELIRNFDTTNISKMINDGYILSPKILDKLHYCYIASFNSDSDFSKYDYFEKYSSYMCEQVANIYLNEKNIDILGMEFFNKFLKLNDPNHKNKIIFKSFFSLDDDYLKLNNELAIHKGLDKDLTLLKEHSNPVMQKLLNINIYKHPVLFFDDKNIKSEYITEKDNGFSSRYKKISEPHIQNFWNSLESYSNIKKTLNQKTFFYKDIENQFMFPLIQRLVESNQLSPKDFFKKHLNDSNNNKQCVSLLLLMMYPEQIEPLLTTENLESISSINNAPKFLRELNILHIIDTKKQKKENLLNKWDSYKKSIYVENNNCIEFAKKLNLSNKTLKIIQSIEELKIENPLVEENNFISNLKSKIIDSLINYEQLTLIDEKDAELILQNTLLEFKKDFNNILEQKNADNFKSLNNNLKFARR